jgi:cytochrome c oxidase subunit 1
MAVAKAPSVPWYGATLKEWLFTTDHKKVGMLYLVTSLLYFAVAGLFGMLVRFEQTAPGIQLPSLFGKTGPDLYNYLLTGHGAVILLWWAVNVWMGGFANILVPLMIGAKDVAFPRLNAFGYWAFFGASVLVLLTLIPKNWIMMMWTGYPPYSMNDNAGPTILYVAIVALYGISSTAGSVNMITTIVSLRAKGLGWTKLNLFVHSIMAASLINLFGVPALLGAGVLLFTDKYLGTNFYNPALGGDPLLYQHLLWFYSHPVVYIMVLPAFGVFSEVISTMSRKPIFGYISMMLAIYAIALVGFFTWVHHMFVSGVPDWTRVIFSYTTLFVAVPTGIKIFNWVATLHKGAIRFNAPMLFTLGGILMFLIGGLTGIPNAMVSIDLGISDSIFVVGHFHYVLGMALTFGAFSGMYYWYPKIIGKMYSEGLAKLSFWLMLIGANIFYFSQMYMGMVHGMPRRYADYPPIPEWVSLMQIQTVGAVILGIGILLSFINWIKSLWGPKAPDNPWGSPSLEWTMTDTPVGPHNFKKYPVEVPEDWHPYAYYKGYHTHI